MTNIHYAETGPLTEPAIQLDETIAKPQTKNNNIGKCSICGRYGRLKGVLCSHCHWSIKHNGDISFAKSSTGESEKVLSFRFQDDWLIPVALARSDKKLEHPIVVSQDDWMHIVEMVERFYQRVSPDDLQNHNNHNYTWIHTGKGTARSEHQKEGFVYLLRSENGYYKIGRTQDMGRRLAQIQHDYPLKIRVIHFFETDNCSKAERELHEIFGHCRLSEHQEWFDLSSEQVDKICALQDWE